MGRQERKLTAGQTGLSWSWAVGLPPWGVGHGFWGVMGRSPSDATQLWSDVDTLLGLVQGMREMRRTGSDLGVRRIQPGFEDIKQ